MDKQQSDSINNVKRTMFGVRANTEKLRQIRNISIKINPKGILDMQWTADLMMEAFIEKYSESSQKVNVAKDIGPVRSSVRRNYNRILMELKGYESYPYLSLDQVLEVIKKLFASPTWHRQYLNTIENMCPLINAKSGAYDLSSFESEVKKMNSIGIKKEPES